MIPVTKPFLPPREDYDRYLDGIWERNHLTNNGPLVQELEKKLESHMGCDYVALLANGTLALQVAIRGLGLQGEIITTPFSYVASSSSIVWEHCTPVFVDIDINTFNIDSSLIESAITEETVGILAVHVYGVPCDVQSLDELSRKYDIPVIYDASHAFGVKYCGRPLYSYGTVSTASFHATKLFHTIEGGATATSDAELHEVIKYCRNFGHDGQDRFAQVGINAKSSEFHAAMGLVNIQYVEEIIARRQHLSECYDVALKGLGLRKPVLPAETEYNYCYYPVVFENSSDLITAMERMARNNIHTRRYFYPSLESLPYLKNNSVTTLDVTNSVSPRVLCLPLFHDLTEEQVSQIGLHLRRDFE